MGSVIQARQRVPAEGVIPLHIDAIAAEKVDEVLRHLRGAHGVEDDFHLDARPGLFGESLSKLTSDVSVPIDVELEVDRLSRVSNRREHRREDPYSVLEQLDLVAMRERRASERMHRLQEP